MRLTASEEILTEAEGELIISYGNMGYDIDAFRRLWDGADPAKRKAILEYNDYTIIHGAAVSDYYGMSGMICDAVVRNIKEKPDALAIFKTVFLNKSCGRGLMYLCDMAINHPEVAELITSFAGWEHVAKMLVDTADIRDSQSVHLFFIYAPDSAMTKKIAEYMSPKVKGKMIDAINDYEFILKSQIIEGFLNGLDGESSLSEIQLDNLCEYVFDKKMLSDLSLTEEQKKIAEKVKRLYQDNKYIQIMVILLQWKILEKSVKNI